VYVYMAFDKKRSLHLFANRVIVNLLLLAFISENVRLSHSQLRLQSLTVWRLRYDVGLDQRSYATSAAVNTEMGDCSGIAQPPSP
jgi:hypothetical protein